MKTKQKLLLALLLCAVLCLSVIPAACGDGGNADLTSVTIPAGVSTIESEAFANCESITSVSISADVTSIGDRAFSGCTMLRDVYYYGTREQWSQIALGSGNNALTDASLHCADNAHIGIVTLSDFQTEDEYRGARAFQALYGENIIKLAVLPDEALRDASATVESILSLAADPDMRAIVVNQAIPGTAEAFRRVKELRPDILCLAGEAHEDLDVIGAAADLVVNNDFVSRGYLMIRTAHELGCDTFVHISFPRHMSYETMSRRVAVMKAACEEFGMKFVLKTAPDPITDVGIAGAQAYVTEHVPQWVEQYGQKAAFFCTNDGHTEPLLRGLLEYGGYFIESDLPSPLLGYPGALGLDLSGLAGDDAAVLSAVEAAVVARGGAGRFGTWTSSYGKALSSGLAQHALNVVQGRSALLSISDLSSALGAFSPGASWNGSNYTDVNTGTASENIFLIYQDTYIMGSPGRHMGTTSITVPARYYTIH